MTDIKLEIRKVDTEKYRDREEEYIAMLYTNRQEKVRKLANAKNRYVSMEAGFLLQDVVRSELGLKAEDIRLERSENGKPELINHSEFHFNISHSGEYVVMAYGRTPVGVDVERVRDKDFRVAKRCFTDEEYEYISQTEDKSNERFFKVWTMKESYLKLTGQGISVPLNSFYVNPDELSAYEKDETDRWSRLSVTFGFEYMDGYVLCVCTYV